MAANLYTAAQNAVFTLVVRCLDDNKTIDDVVGLTPSAGDPTGGAADAWEVCRNIGEFFEAVSVGSRSVNINYADGNVTGFATGTITFTGNPSNNDTVTIAGVTITFVSGTPSGSQIKIGASQAATMATLVAFINAAGSANNLQGVITAVVTSATVITMYSYYPGLIGNLITCTKSCANISAITATFASGILVNQQGPLSVGI